MISTAPRTDGSAPQQLTLLTDVSADRELRPSSAPARFRLSKTTRERGLAHVAEIRRQLADAQARREAELATLAPTASQAA